MSKVIDVTEAVGLVRDGATALTRMPRDPNSRASERVKPIRPAFAAL